MPVTMPPNTANHPRSAAVRVYQADRTERVREPSRELPPAASVLPAAPQLDTAPAERALAAGIAAAWTGHCDGTVDLKRLAGPRDCELTVADVGFLNLPGSPPWRLSRPSVRCALYEWALTHGTQFDIYRWVNLVDLAAVWDELNLSDGVRAEWERVLRAASLLPTN